MDTTRERANPRREEERDKGNTPLLKAYENVIKNTST